jgi:hypothetical protein
MRHVRTATTLALVLGGAIPLAAQDFPGKPLIQSAVQQINSVAPPAMPQQTIRIGAYNGATKQFAFTLPDYYPPELPPAKRQDEGGPVAPQHVPDINSVNVTYEILVANPPADLRITLVTPAPNGQKTTLTATVSGGKATIPFSPRVIGLQNLFIHGASHDTGVVLTPRLRPQLGAFSVPYLLAAIVYEPPGKGSSADYSQTSTSNTVVSWSHAQGSGLVETEDPEAFINLANKAVAAGLDKLSPGTGTVWTTVANLREQTTVTKTTSTSVSTDGSSGVSFAVTVGFTTNTHQYPGAGDLYVVLQDVLFVYLAQGNKIVLSPMAYSGVNYMIAAELKQRLPAAVADKFVALNPHSGNVQLASRTLTLGVPRGGGGTRLEAFAPVPQIACKNNGAQHVSASREEFQSSGTSQTTSETEVYHVSGLMASIMGGGDRMETTSYTTAKTQGTSQTQSTQIVISCAGDQEFWVKVYLDNLFRTLYTLRGAPLSNTAAVAGTAQQDNGQPAANQLMRLDVGGETYAAYTDASGNFSFPVAPSRGNATLTVAGRRYPLALSGASRNVLLKAGTITERAPQRP